MRAGARFMLLYLQCLAAFLAHSRCSVWTFWKWFSYLLSQFHSTNWKVAELLSKTRSVHPRANGTPRNLSKLTQASRRVQMMALGYLLLLFHLASPWWYFGSKLIQHLLVHPCQQLVIVTCLPQARAHYWAPDMFVTMPSTWDKNLKGMDLTSGEP